MLDTVKMALRISHISLDNEITRLIAVARLELIRVGILEAMANSEDDGLINQAIVTYCLSKMSDGTKSEKYEESFVLLTDELRKSSGYFEAAIEEVI